MDSCIGKIAQSIGMDCSNPIVGGYTGRAIIMSEESAIASIMPYTTKNNVIVGKIAGDIKRIDNAMLTIPFDGSNDAGTNDAGFPQFVKVVSGRIPMRGANVSKVDVEALTHHGNKYVVFLEKRQKHTYRQFGAEVVGLYGPLCCVDPSTVTRNENENGGFISFSLQATEPYFDVVHTGGFGFQDLWDSVPN